MSSRIMCRLALNVIVAVCVGVGGGEGKSGGGKEESLKIQIVRRKKLIHSKCANI